MNSRCLYSLASSRRGDNFLSLMSSLLLYLLNDLAEQNIPNWWSIAPWDVINVQEPACIPPQSNTFVAMEEILCMICYYKVCSGKKKRTDRKKVVQWLLSLFLATLWGFSCLFFSFCLLVLFGVFCLIIIVTSIVIVVWCFAGCVFGLFFFCLVGGFVVVFLIFFLVGWGFCVWGVLGAMV